MVLKDPYRKSWLRRLVAIPNTPYALGVDEWDEWEKQSRAKYPVRFFLDWTLPVWWSRSWRRIFHDPWYWTKCRLWHRYNVVYCKHLPPTWNDRDSVMLHACFQLLVDFIEKEEPWEFKATDDELTENWLKLGAEQRAAEVLATWKNLRELYAWWLARRDDYSDRDDDDAMLARLIADRTAMWT